MPRPGLLKQEIIRIYWDIKNSGKPVFTRDIAERVTLSKMKGDALKAQIAEYLKAENLLLREVMAAYFGTGGTMKKAVTRSGEVTTKLVEGI